MNHNRLKKGDIVSEHQFYKVKEFTQTGVAFINDDGIDIHVANDIVNSCMSDASQFDEEVEVSRTRLIEIFTQNPRIAMTVSFTKKINTKEVAAELYKAFKNKENLLASDIEFLMRGKERIMRGRHEGQHDDFNRIQFVDMDIKRDTSKEYDTRLRKVDPRTLNWVIVNNVKFKIKS